MTTKELGIKLVELCQKGEFHIAMTTLYSPDIVSVEAMAMPSGSAESKGIEAVLAKGKWWVDNHEVHESKVSGPFVNGERFIVLFDFDITQKFSGKRMKMVETGLYFVSGGKIVREEFFYATQD